MVLLTEYERRSIYNLQFGICIMPEMSIPSAEFQSRLDILITENCQPLTGYLIAELQYKCSYIINVVRKRWIQSTYFIVIVIFLSVGDYAESTFSSFYLSYIFKSNPTSEHFLIKRAVVVLVWRP